MVFDGGEENCTIENIQNMLEDFMRMLLKVGIFISYKFVCGSYFGIKNVKLRSPL